MTLLLRAGKWSAVAGLALLALGAAGTAAHAQMRVAVFGNNNVDNFINGGMTDENNGTFAGIAGFQAQLVTDAQLADPNFDLSAFSAFIYTRNGTGFGTSLSPAGAQRVRDFVTGGSMVLFNGDYADALSDDLADTLATPEGGRDVRRLFENSVRFAAQSGRGFIGEFTGTSAAFEFNTDTENPDDPSAGPGPFTPLGLSAGRAGSLTFGGGGSLANTVVDAEDLANPIFAGVSPEFNPRTLENGATIVGFDPTFVVATYGGDRGNPAIFVRQGGPAGPGGVIPEPGTISLLGGTGLLGLAGLVRRRRG